MQTKRRNDVPDPGPDGCRFDGGSLVRIVASVIFSLALVVPQGARGADGCTALLCLTSGNWNAIAQCVPTVREVLRDLARGKPFPSCPSAGTSNGAVNEWAAAPSVCPPQYTRVQFTESATVYSCDYTGAISVRITGQLFLRTWWRESGDSVTEFSDAAKSTLGSWDTRFEDDYALWLAAQPPQPSELP